MIMYGIGVSANRNLYVCYLDNFQDIRLYHAVVVVRNVSMN